MALNKVFLNKISLKSIYDRYTYTTGDTLAECLTTGYFSGSPFDLNSPTDPIIEIDAIDGSTITAISLDDYSVVGIPLEIKGMPSAEDVTAAVIASTKAPFAQKLNYTDVPTIAGAVQGWWGNPVVFRRTDAFGDNTFIGAADEFGGLIVALYDHNTDTVRRRNIATWEIDDHNVPAFTQRLDGRVLVAYARHAEENFIRYRISQTANMDDWAEEQTLATSDKATYVQIFRQSSAIHLFYRVGASGGGGWAHRRSTDNGITWTAEVIIADTEYCIIVPSADEFSFRIFSYENPTSGTDHDIYYMLMNSTSGSLTKPGGTTLGNAFTATNTPIAPASMQKAVDVNSATISTRLMAAAKSSSPTCLAVEFTSASTTDGKLYRYVYASSGALFTRKYICDVGVPFAASTQYHGGACFGDDSNTVYVARNTGAATDWTLDKYVTSDSGGSWTKTTLFTDSSIIARPSLFDTDKVIISQFSNYVSYEDFDDGVLRIINR